MAVILCKWKMTKTRLLLRMCLIWLTGIMENEIPLKLVFHDLQEMVLDHELKLYLKGDVPYISFKWEGRYPLKSGCVLEIERVF